MYKRHIVIDLEFTPIPKRFQEQREIVRHEVIQIGAVLLDQDYRKISTFSTYVKPAFAVHIKPSVTRLTGITDQDVKNAPSFAQAMEKLTAWIGTEDRTRIYSWSDTDLHQFRGECALKGIPFPNSMGRWLDFQKVYGRLIGSRHQLSLKKAVLSANGQFFGTLAHTALYDAIATAELLIMTVSGSVHGQKMCKGCTVIAAPQTFTTTIGELYGAQLAKFLT